MATPKTPGASHHQSSAVLLEKLAAVLPKGYKFGVYHLSTPPTRSEALCSAPPDARPDRTYTESHFLAITIDDAAKNQLATTSLPSSPMTPRIGSEGGASSSKVLIFAIEIFIFTTAYSSTLFVSKADSTGYLHLLNLPKGAPSPIREVSSTLISYLVDERRRKGIQTVVSLFARAQGQYLFPGSVEYQGKHVLDDRGLIKWWCRVLNPMLENQATQEDQLFRPSKKKRDWESFKAYLTIPGLEQHESRAYLPRTPNAASNWVLGHPLSRISHFAREYDWVPPQCLIPRYPDDPKSRFRDELDQEASQWSEYKDKGSWRNVKTVDQFWDMMAYRQECSGGHMTGFIWVVFEPEGWGAANETIELPDLLTPNASQMSQPSTPPRRRNMFDPATPRSSPLKMVVTPGSTQQSPLKQSPSQQSPSKQGPSKTAPEKKVLKGRIIPRQPRVKTHARDFVPDIPISTSYYYWPTEGRGTRIVAEADYKRSTELLMRLDFENLELATASTRRWISEVGGGLKWAQEVVGRRHISPALEAAPVASTMTINNMSGLVRKKRPADAKSGDNGDGTANVTAQAVATNVHVLSTRKKPKAEDCGYLGQTDTPPASSAADAAQVNSMGTGSVRKKRKQPADDGTAVAGDHANAGTTAENSSHDALVANVLGTGLVRKKPRIS